MPHETRPKLNWRAVSPNDKAADAEDVSWDGRELWDDGKEIDPDSMVGFLVEMLLGEDDNAPCPPLAPAIEILAGHSRVSGMEIVQSSLARRSPGIPL